MEAPIIDSNSIADSSESQAWAVAAKAGNEQAFEWLFKRYLPMTASIVRRFVSDHETAQDVVMTVWESCHAQIGEFDPNHQFATWVGTMAKNRAIDHLRKSSRRSELDRVYAAQPREEFDSPRHELQDYGRAARKLVDTLPEDQRVAITMIYLNGLSQSQATAKLKLPLGTVKARARRGLRVLRKLMTGPRPLQAVA
jgi:RNA polymerase sigma-70 factor (ECF subfamily)